RDRHIRYSINGRLMTDLIDNSPLALRDGILALQLHEGYTMDIRFKDLRLKVLARASAMGQQRTHAAQRDTGILSDSSSPGPSMHRRWIRPARRLFVADARTTSRRAPRLRPCVFGLH